VGSNIDRSVPFNELSLAYVLSRPGFELFEYPEWAPEHLEVQDVLNLSLYGESAPHAFDAPAEKVKEWAEELENEIFYWIKFRVPEGEG